MTKFEFLCFFFLVKSIKIYLNKIGTFDLEFDCSESKLRIDLHKNDENIVNR